jgi:hypothetical protein
MLQEPPADVPFLDQTGSYQVREVVRINHLRNCRLCHSPGTSTTDLVLAQEPTPGQPLPSRPYYGTRSGSGPFVRADTTYLKQDFSVLQKVANPDRWPELQRFDFVVWTRPSTTPEGIARVLQRAEVLQPPSLHEQAIRYALQELRSTERPQAIRTSYASRFGGPFCLR